MASPSEPRRRRPVRADFHAVDVRPCPALDGRQAVCVVAWHAGTVEATEAGPVYWIGPADTIARHVYERQAAQLRRALDGSQEYTRRPRP